MRIAFSWLACFLILFSFASESYAAPRPNVVLIFTDDMSRNEVGVYNRNAVTPHIDRLAQNGIKFHRFYVSSPVCSPSRYNLLTGRYATRSESLKNKFPPGTHATIDWSPRIMRNEWTVQNALKKSGYYTGMVGKWHQSPGNAPGMGGWKSSLDYDSPDGQKFAAERYEKLVRTVKQHGFDYADGIYARNVNAILPEGYNVHNQEWITKAALDFLDKADQRSSKPFFLYFSTTVTHWPYDLDQSLKSDPRVTPAGYLDEAPDMQPPRTSVLERTKGLSNKKKAATWLDDSIGVLVSKLEELGVKENTLILFLSDHAIEGKFSVYEGGAHVPAVASWPGSMNGPGRTVDHLVSSVDVAPTLYELAGINPSGQTSIDGKSFAPLLTGRGTYSRDSLFLQINNERAVVTEDNWKYVAVRFPEEIQEKVENGQTFTHYGKRPKNDQHTYGNENRYPHYYDLDQLYNLNKDPNEKTNLVDDPKHAERLKRMKRELETYLRSTPHSFGEFTE